MWINCKAIATKFSYLKEHYVVLEKKIQTQNFDIYNNDRW